MESIPNVSLECEASTEKSLTRVHQKRMWFLFIDNVLVTLLTTRIQDLANIDNVMTAMSIPLAYLGSDSAPFVNETIEGEMWCWCILNGLLIFEE